MSESCLALATRAALLSAAQSEQRRVTVHVAHLREMIATEGQLATDNAFLSAELLATQASLAGSRSNGVTLFKKIDQLRADNAQASRALATVRSELSDMQRVSARLTKASRSRLTASNAFALVSLVIMGAAGYLALFGHV